MQCCSTFSEFLQASLKAWSFKRADECVLSLALPSKSLDPLEQLPLLSVNQQFSFLWDRTPGLCIAAAGKCQNFELVGPRRFELAQRFSDETLDRLIDGTPEAPSHSKARVLFAFTFFEQTPELKIDGNTIPAVQAVLPSWQLTRQSGQSWLRLNAVVSQKADLRDLVEQIWLMREHLNGSVKQEQFIKCNSNLGISISKNWQQTFRSALTKGIDLINTGELQKLVLAVKEPIQLQSPLDPLKVLSTLRRQQKGSCRFLWKRSKSESFFGASPERLLSIRQGVFRTDALAGTASIGNRGDLLRSDKDLREHEMVVNSILKQVISQDLQPYRSRSPRLARHGHLVHLHTPIIATTKKQLPLQLAQSLHPTPAVAGLPRDCAMQWIRTLENFDRGNYAAPIGWIDQDGNTEFRVAIRCGYLQGSTLELMAGAGLVKGSVLIKELEEVELKLAVMSDQILPKSPFSRQGVE